MLEELVPASKGYYEGCLRVIMCRDDTHTYIYISIYKHICILVARISLFL